MGCQATYHTTDDAEEPRHTSCRSWTLRRQAGNAYIEYFVVALIVALATVAFYDRGRFLGGQRAVDQAFRSLWREVCAGCDELEGY